MVQQLNGKEVKQKIFKYLEEKGPELPVHIAKHISMNTLFASAFLSEMASEGTVKISDMKVGGSPLYFTQSRIALLENFTKFLNEKEREAWALLKEKGILSDEDQHPAIRVALRGLKDFAILNEKDGRKTWRYFLAEPKKAEEKIEPREKPKLEKIELAQEQPKIDVEKSSAELEKLNLEIEEKRKELESLKQKQVPGQISKKSGVKSLIKQKRKPKPGEKEKFLNEIKESLEKKGINIISIESFDKKQVFAKVAISGNEHLIAAYDKKKIDDSDLIKAYKKSLALGVPYSIISRGNASKRTEEAIEAHKRLVNIDILERENKKPLEVLPEKNAETAEQ